MKRIFTLLVSLVFISFGVQAQDIHPGPYVLSPDALMQMDSAYEFNWQSNAWVVKTKNYKIRNNDGLITEDLYRKIHPLTQQWSNYMRFVNEYEVGSVPSSVTGQYWTLAGDWITYQYTHNTNKAPDEFWEKMWNPQKQKFTSGFRNLYTYENSNLTSRIYQQYDTIANVFNNSVKYQYFWNGNIKTEDVYSLWVDTSWVNNYRMLDTYNNDQKLLEHQEFSWVDTASAWLEVSRTTHTYDIQGHRDYTLIQSWDNFALSWDSIQQATYIYNNEGWLLNETSVSFNPFTGDWVPYSIVSHAYFPDGKPRKLITDLWNANNSEWVNVDYTETDSVGHITVTYQKYIDYTTYEITAGTYQQNTYNSNSDIVETVNRTWDVNSADWQNQNKISYTYDAENHLTDKLTSVWSVDWTNNNLYQYYWSEPIGIGEIQETRLCSFPNPLRGGSVISCSQITPGSTISLVSLTGSIVWKEKYTGSSIIVPAGIAGGMYILQVISEGKPAGMQKVIVTR